MEFRNLEDFIAWLQNGNTESVQKFLLESGIVFTEEVNSFMGTPQDRMVSQLEVFERISILNSFDSSNYARLKKEEQGDYSGNYDGSHMYFDTASEAVEWALDHLKGAGMIEWK